MSKSPLGSKQVELLCEWSQSADQDLVDFLRGRGNFDRSGSKHIDFYVAEGSPPYNSKLESLVLSLTEWRAEQPSKRSALEGVIQRMNSDLLHACSSFARGELERRHKELAWPNANKNHLQLLSEARGRPQWKMWGLREATSSGKVVYGCGDVLLATIEWTPNNYGASLSISHFDGESWRVVFEQERQTNLWHALQSCETWYESEWFDRQTAPYQEW